MPVDPKNEEKPGPAAEEAAPPKLDAAARERLERVGGEALVFKIFGLFLERAPEVMRQARAAAESGDRPEVERLTHGLVSSASYVGADNVAEHARAVEHAAADADEVDLAGMIAQLDDALASVLPLVEARSR